MQLSPKVYCMCVLSFSQKCLPSKKILANSQLFLTDPRISLAGGQSLKA